MTVTLTNFQKVVHECLSLLEILNSQQKNSINTRELDVFSVLNYREINKLSLQKDYYIYIPLIFLAILLIS